MYTSTIGWYAAIRPTSPNSDLVTRSITASTVRLVADAAGEPLCGAAGSCCCALSSDIAYISNASASETFSTYRIGQIPLCETKDDVHGRAEVDRTPAALCGLELDP